MIEITRPVLTSPLKSIQIQTTSMCNAVCAMCPYPTSWMTTKEGKGVMTDEIYEKIIFDLKDQNFQGDFIPYLGNETFMDPKMVDRIEFAIDNLPNIKLTLDSNMSTLNEKKIDRLYDVWKKVNFRGKFTISHHGIDKTTVEAIMGISYERCLKNIIYFIKKFSDTNLKIIIHSCCDFGLSDVDINGMFEDSSLGKKKFTRDAYKRVTWDKVTDYWNNIVKDNDIDPEKFTILKKKAPDETKDAPRHGRVSLYHLIPNSKANRAPVPGRDLSNWKRTNCARIYGWMHIHWNGQVTLCCRTVYDNKSDVILGNIKDNTMQEILSSQQCRSVYDKVQGKIESRYDFPCKSC